MFKRVGIAVGVFCLSAGLASAQTLYGTTGSSGAASNLYTLSTTTGLATLVGATGFSGIGSLAFSPGGLLFGVANASGRVLVRINTTTGVATSIGATGIADNFTDLAFRSDGTLFGMTGHGLFCTINTTTGLGTIVTSEVISIEGGGLAFNASNTLFYISNTTLYTVDQTTGALTSVGTVDFTGLPAGADRVAGMKFHPVSGLLYGIAFLDSDPATSTRLATASNFSGTVPLTNVGNPGVALEAVAFSPLGVPVLPRPVLAALGILLAAVGVWMSARRGRHSRHTIA